MAIGAVERGRQVFAEHCARCHSSQKVITRTTDFAATDPADPTLRLDWLGNDEIAPASEIGTYPARALHSNHMKSRVWAEYASLTEQARPADPLRPEVINGGGRGYYRNVSLLSVWAHAPFMHNNAIGPEICGRPSRPGARLLLLALRRRRRQAARRRRPTAGPSTRASRAATRSTSPRCRPCSTPTAALPKLFVLDRDIVIDIAPKVTLLGRDLGLTLTIPAGFPAVDVNSLRYKDLIQDLVLVGRDPDKFERKYATLLTERAARRARGRAPGDPRGAPRHRDASPASSSCSTTRRRWSTRSRT